MIRLSVRSSPTSCVSRLAPSKSCIPKETNTKTFSSGKWVDLSYDFSYETIYWPTSGNFQLQTVFKGPTKKGYYYAAYKYCAAEHGGTHIDAPIHFAINRKTVDQLPIDQLIGSGIVIDVTKKTSENRDYQISIDDFKQWERKNGEIPKGAIVLLSTGFGKYWPDRKKYMGTDKRGREGVKELSFPGLHPDAATWLVENKSIKAIGLDTPSIDYGKSEFFRRNIPAFENVANLHVLPNKGFTVIALPMKIRGGSGAPLRIIAHIEG